MDDRTVYNDAELQQLERQYRGAVPIIYCARDKNHCKGWTGFVISKFPLIIITVSHSVTHLSTSLLNSKLTFFVKFYGDCNYYPADALRWDHQADLLVLNCPRPSLDFSPFTFIDPDLPFLSSKSLFSISHAGDRPWRAIRGSICSPTFLRGDPNFHLDSVLFDHDLQLYPGGSGAPLIDLMGRVCGMQVSEIAFKEHVFSVAAGYRKKMDQYTSDDVANISRQISEVTIRPTNLKQGTPVHELAKRLKELFLEEGVNPRTGLTYFLRRSVSLLLQRQREVHRTPNQPPSATASPAQAPQSSTRPQKRPPRRKKKEVFCGRKTSQSMTLQYTLLHKEFGKKPVVSSSNGFAIPRSDLKVLIASYEASKMHLSIFSGSGSRDLLICDEAHMLKNCQTLTNRPEDCEGGDTDLATVAVDPLIPKFLGLCKRNFKRDPSTLAGVLCKRQIPLSGTPLSDEIACSLSSKSGSCGLNMIGGNQLVLFDPVWNPAEVKEAAARVWRDGLKDTVCRFLSTETTEEKVYQRQMSEERLQKVIQELTYLTNQPEDCEGGDNDLATVPVDPLIAQFLGPHKRNIRRDPSTLAAVTCKLQIPLSGSPSSAAARVWRDGLKDREYFCRFFSTGITEEKVYQRQISQERLQKVIQEQTDFKNQGKFLLTEVLKDLFPLHENASSEMYEKMNCVRSRSWVGMVNDMPECYGEEDEAGLASVNCKSDQEDIGAFAGSTGCLHMLNSSQVRKEMVALSNDIDGGADQFGTDGDNNGSDVKSLADVNCQSNHEDIGASAGSTGCLHMLNSLEKQQVIKIRKEMVALSNDVDGASDRCFGMDAAADNNGSAVKSSENFNILVDGMIRLRDSTP